MPAIGELAPDFELLDDEGKPVKLSSLRGKKVVLYFYPADFTSGCELQACSFRDAYSQIEAKNAVVLGVSPDSVENDQKFRNTLNLPFHLLADSNFAQAEVWGCYGTRTNNDGTNSPRIVRSHYVIDEKGKVIDVQTPVKPNESVRLALDKL